MRILMVEDNPYKAGVMDRLLLRKSITCVLWKTNLQDAANALSTQDFDVLLLDMFFPDAPGGREKSWAGIDVLDEMNRLGKHFPVIVTSTVRSEYYDYPDVIGQAQYNTEDFEFNFNRLIDQIRKK